MNGLEYFYKFGDDPKTWGKFALAIYWGYADKPEEIVKALDPLQVDDIRLLSWGSGTGQNAHSVFAGGGLVLQMPGLRSPADLVAVTCNSRQTPCLGIPGSIMIYTRQVATGMHAVIDAEIVRCSQFYGISKVPVLFTAHSHGGSIASAYFADHTAIPTELGSSAIVSYGSPRCIDPIAAANVPCPRFNVWHVNDLIPALPPSLWPQFYNPYIFPHFDSARYQRQGQSWILRKSGKVEFQPSDTPKFPDTLAIGVNAVSFLFDQPAHDIGEMSRRLNRSSGSFSVSGFAGESDTNSVLGGPGMPTLFLSSFNFIQGPYKWKEQIHIVKDTLQDAHAAATSTALIGARQKLLATSTLSDPFQPQLLTVVTRDTTRTRSSATYKVPPPASFSTSVSGANNPNNNLLLKLQSDTIPSTGLRNLQRSLFMRGFPDDIVTAGGQYRGAGSTWEVDLGTWIGFLNAAGFVIHAKDVSPTIWDVDNIANVVGPPPKILVTPHIAPTFTGRGEINLFSAEPPKILRGRFNVTSDGTIYTIKGLNFVGTFTDFGRGQEVQFVDVPIRAGYVLRASHRDTAASEFNQKGRSKNRV